jgi:hypothetical protein
MASKGFVSRSSLFVFAALTVSSPGIAQWSSSTPPPEQIRHQSMIDARRLTAHLPVRDGAVSSRGGPRGGYGRFGGVGERLFRTDFSALSQLLKRGGADRSR